jgi:hypothetical protein
VTREARKGENEAWFREVNERLEERAEKLSRTAETFEVVCECAREECTERIAVSFRDYEAVRDDPKRFLVIPGHVDPTCERVVGAREGFQVVEKLGEAGVTAEVENPRAG